MTRVASFVPVLCLFFQLGFIGQSWAATKVRGFPVRLDGAADVAPPLAIDIDGDGRLELVVATRNQLFVLEADGTKVPGFPVTFKRGEGVATPLSIGYLGPVAPAADNMNKSRHMITDDGDKKGNLPSIVFGSTKGTLVVIEADGKMRRGFPYKHAGILGGAPALADLNEDGDKDIVFGTHGGQLMVLDGKGRSLSGFPLKLAGSISTAVTVGRFTPKGPKVLFFGDDAGGLHAFGLSGREMQGFPYMAKFTIANQVVLGDIDDDGQFEIIFGSKDYKIHVVEFDGKPAKGFPVETAYRIYSSCALSDLDGDGVVDIVAASGDGKLYAYGAGGRSIKGFPVKVGSRLRGSPLVSDVDLDGKMEIALGSDRNRLFLLRSNGRTYPGFPARMRDKVVVSPLMADLTGNGLNEIIAVSKDGTLMAFRMLRKGKGTSAVSWPAEGRDTDRSGLFHPNPPRYVDLGISPSSPSTLDPLKLSYRFFDMDGDAEPRTLIRWYKNGKPVQELDGKRTVPAKFTGKHQRWNFVLQADTKQRKFKSPMVAVTNTAPGAPKIALLPEHARTGDDLRMKVTEESVDVDGDRIRYRIRWLKDRLPQKRMSKDSVRARNTSKGQRWTVVVVPFDGEVTGTPARTSLVVANTAPGAAKISLVPERPSVSVPVSVKIDRPGRDVDGDKVVYLYRWLGDEKELNLPESDGTMPAGMVAKHKKIKVEVSSFDGEERGAMTKAEVKVVNTVPSAPVVKIEPALPVTTDDLQALVMRPGKDPDMDHIRYRFSWSREGRDYKGKFVGSSVLPASETKKGEKWSIRVIPNDGQADGKAGLATTELLNSPPTATSLRQLDPRPATDKELIIKSSGPPKDPDGDASWYEVLWRADGKVLSKGKDLFSLAASLSRKHVKYEAVLTPRDGTSSGSPVNLWFEVRNSPPGACKVGIEPQRPKTGDVLKAVMIKQSEDKDGDKVKYMYRWYRDGRPSKGKVNPSHVSGSMVKRGSAWTVVATPSDGESSGSPCSASVTVANHAPDSPVVQLFPKAPSAGDSLVLKMKKSPYDMDGDKVEISVRWKVDGRLFAVTDQNTSVAKGILKKGQHWTVEVVASDGELMSKPAVVETRIVNSPPLAPSVEIRPKAPLSSDELHCRLSAATLDPDGDRLKHSYKWYQVAKKGQDLSKLKPAAQGASLDAGFTKKGQLWECTAQASDGAVWGKFGKAFVKVKNASPTAPVISISPASPRANQELRCLIKEPAKDPDGDRVRYHFTWFKDGVKQGFAPETDRVPVRLTKPDDIWQCKALASDGSLWGPAAESEEALVVSAGM